MGTIIHDNILSAVTSAKETLKAKDSRDIRIDGLGERICIYLKGNPESQYNCVCIDQLPTGEQIVFNSIMRTFPKTDPESALDYAIDGGANFQFIYK